MHSAAQYGQCVVDGEFTGDRQLYLHLLIFIDCSEADAVGEQFSVDSVQTLGAVNRGQQHLTIGEYKTTDLKDVKSGRVNVLANINSYREITTKKGDLMAFLDISDDTDNIDAVMFPEVYKTYREQILGRGIVLAQGKVEKRNDSLQLVIDKIRSLTIDK